MNHMDFCCYFKYNNQFKINVYFQKSINIALFSFKILQWLIHVFKNHYCLLSKNFERFVLSKILGLIKNNKSIVMNDTLGIMNNRFHKKAIQSRKRNTSVDTNTIIQKQKGNKKNEYYERWLTNYKKPQSRLDSESNLDNQTPQTPKAQIPIQFEPKLIRDVVQKFYPDKY
ncbi:unnamed protein product [Paramecium octaurelia]|uniref:Uncharacterized protein n=1 Tax=Paramecium octaurelia TaxID=43137 RepID=A0A8S1XET2_PAROT|nr:unnamed protein product [Paramecium octaurelia]